MRSNVRKMWTALLAVLFAVAVGFGLWFAFAPAARPSNVHAAEETTVEIKKTENASTLYSNQPVEQLLGQFISGTVTLAGASTPSDLLSFAATGGVSYQVYAQYDAEQDQLSEERDDLRPDSDETAESYSRWVVAIAEVDGVPIESNPLELTVTKATISSLTAWFSGNNTFSALTAIPQDAPLTVQVMYSPGAGQPFSPDRGSEYGTYQIIYNQEGEYTDRLEYRDTSITIKYTEGNVSKSVQVAVNVSEAYVETPRWKDYNAVPELSYTGEERTVELEKYDSTSLTNDANVESEDGILSLTGTDADEYSVTISVKEGYKFREDFPQYATATYKDGKIVALKYTWKITQASINSVTVMGNWKDGWTFGTPDAAPSKENVELNILYEGSSETVTKSPDEVGATVTFAFSGTANDGTEIDNSTDLPKKAGEYTWTVSLTGMKNFKDFNGTDSNGGSGSFVIEKKTLSVHALESTKLAYTGEAQSATAATYEEDLMSFDGDLDGEERINVGTYRATFTLTDPDNYKWEEGAAVSGEKEEVATVTWEIIQAKNTISDFGLAQSSWAWSETAAPSPSATAKFGGGITYKYYSDATLQNEITSPTTWNVGTYYVTATSSSDTSEHKNYTSVRTEAIPFTVSRAGIAQPELSQSEFTYDGTKKTPTLNVSSQYYTFTVEGKTDAGDYKATVTLDDNHCWKNVTGDAATAALELDWKILPAGIGVEGNLSIEGWTYGEEVNKPVGVTLDDDTNALLGTATATFKYEYKLSSAKDSAYTTTAPTDAGDYTVRLTISVNNNFKNYTATANFTIEKDELTFGDATGVLGWTWGDNTIPEHNGLIPAATYGTNEGEKVSSFTYTYYKAENGAISGDALTGTPSDAGNYILRVSVSEGDNYKAGSKDYSFTVKQGQASISIKIEGADNWVYLDLAENHAITVTVTVGEGNHAEITPQITYYTRGWNENGDWTTTQKPGDNSAAGYYYIGVEVANTDNYTGTSLGEDDTENQFTIHKKQISIPALKDDDGGAGQRQLEFNGNPQAPEKIINVSNNVLACGTIEGATINFLRYEVRYEGSLTGGKPQSYGDYFIVLQINEADRANYTWKINEQDQLGELKDVPDANEVLKVAFSITGTQYEIEISNEGWTIAEGSGITKLPNVEGKTESDKNTLKAALQASGVTVTFAYYLDGQDEAIATVSNGNSLTLSAVPEAVALHAGKYTLTVFISRSTNNDYSSSSASATFTVSAYELTADDVGWTVPSDLIYKGTEYTFGGAGSNIYATYKTWSYANGVYFARGNGGYLTLALTGEAEEILNAGEYTLSASLPENEHAVALLTDAEYAKNTIEVGPKKIDVTLNGYSETYKGTTLSGSFPTSGHSYNGQTLFTIEGGGLCGSDTLEGTFTYPKNAINAGSYAWGDIAWSNTNYAVTVTYADTVTNDQAFTIDPAPITVKINDQSSVYGENIVSPTVEASKNTETDFYTVTGTLYDNANTIFSLSTKATSSSNVGLYDIEGDVLEGEGNRGGNYNVIFVGEEKAYSITARELKVVLNDFEAVYGTKETTETLKNHVTFSYNGSETVFVSEDDRVAALNALSFTVGEGSYAENSEAGSTWTVTPDVGPVQNYTFTVQSGTMTVKPRPITVEISDVSVTYGTAGTLGVNSVSYTGGGSSEAVISSDLAGGDGAEKYANVFTLALYENNSGTLGKLIAPDDYGSLNRGEYLISLTKVSENYEITFEDATYTVNAQSIGVILVLDTRGHEESSPVFDGLAWKYLAYGSDESGASIEEITFHVTYYHALQDVRGDELNGAPVNAGSYYAVVDTVLDEDGNYIAGGSFSVPFTIAQCEVSVTWFVDGSQVTNNSLGYNGDTGYTITAQYYGWTDGSKNAAPTSLTVTAPSDFRNVGSYSFTAGFKTDDEKGNYTFGDADDEDSVTQTFSIAQAKITVAIKPQSSIYGEKIVSLKVPADMAAENSLYTIIEGKIYDNADTIFTLQAQKDDGTPLQNGDDARDYKIVGSTTGEDLINSGNYEVTLVDADDSGVSYGAYTVTRRPVQIALNDFSMIYGTDISAGENREKLVGLSGLSFGLGTGTTGSPFLTEDSGAEAAAKSAMNFGFADTSGTYDAQSAANTTWTVTASLSDQASDDLKNYTFVEGASTMTVIPRPITVTLPQLGSTSYTYGTAALENAFSTFMASETLSNDWAGYGDAIVFNDNAAGGVYTLVVRNEEGKEITLSASTPVGTYTLAGKAGGDSNYSVTFTAEQPFSVTEARFEVNAQDPVSVSVVYTGKNYYFRSDAADQQDPEGRYLFNYGLIVTTDFVLSKENIAYTWEFNDDSLTYLTDAGEYTVSYTVTADNFETVTGSFEVIISQATNKWTAGMTTTDGGEYEQASWTYGDPKKYSSLNWTDTFTGYAPSTQFVAEFGKVQIEYYKTRSGGPSEYTYSDQITDPGTFFGCETAVGTYYVKVYVTETDDYKGLTAHGTIVVNQRAVDIDWAANNITVDGETHEGTNTTIGFDNTLMTVDTESLPQGLTIADSPSATGEITVKVKAEGTTQFYLYFELIDPDNYCWEESATVSGDKDERIQINFTTNALQNNVTFKGQDGDLSQNTGISISFGTELRYKFASSSGDTIGDAHLLIFADSTLANETLNYYISFARTTQGDKEPIDDSYTLATLNGADAGCYWLRVQVYPTSDSSYGYGIGYLKVTITQKEITQDDIGGIDFGLSGDELHFTYDGQAHQPSAEGVPSYLSVEFDGSATDVCDGKVTVTATFTIADDNYKFADGVSPTREITVVIDPYEIGHIVWSDREYTYNGTDQTEDVYAYFVDVFGVEHRLRVTADDVFKTVTADGTTFTALLELYEAQEDFCIQNYKFAEDLAELTHVYQMAKATVEIGIGDAEAVYTGEPIEIDQTQYALRTAISLSDPEILDFLSKIRLIAVDDEGNPAVNVDSYKIILEEKEWAYTNIEIVFNDSYAGQLTVSPAPREVPVLDKTQFVYNGSVQKPNVTGVDDVYTVKNEGGTDVGTYSVTFTLVTENYYWATEEENVDTVTLYYKIVQAEYSFSFDVSDTVYNGAPVSVNAPGLPAGETGASVAYLFTGMMNGGRAYSSSDEPTEAGSYTVRVTISGMKNYKDAEESAEFTIERAPIEVSLTFKPQVDGGNGWVYGAEPTVIYELQGDSNPGGGDETATYSTGSWSGSAIPTEVGEYTLTVTVAETNNYESGSVSVKFKIVQASEDELSFTVSIEGWTYGEKPHAPSVIWGDGLTGHPDQISPVYTYAKAKADGETYSDKDFSSTVPTNAGSYVVKATFAETDHYGELSAMCKFKIGKAVASIDTSGVKTNFTYNGRAQAVGGAVLNHSEVTLTYSPASVTAVGSYTVTISAAESTNYTAATATVTVTVSRASAGFSVSIDDWTYGETPSRYTISGGSGGSVTVTYSGTTNAGVKYSSSKAPTEAGEYTITVVMGASGNFLGGTARDSFTIHRAKAEAELSLAGWMYGEEPNAYVLTPEFLRGEVVRVIYTDGTYYSEAVPKEVGSYTVTVIYAETDNYLGGEVSCKFSIVPYGLGLTVTLEGWTYGDKANEPIVTGAGGIGLMYAYTGTANDGTVWNSNTAPEKAGSYTLTVTVIEAGNYTGESASTDFVIARRLLSAPAWDEEGMRELIEVCSGDRMTRAILGFDMSLMNAQSATAQFMFDGTGAASVTANIHGVYTIVVSLRDAANYGWADLNEGETLTGPVTLTWTLTERVISLLWLIILLAVLTVIALIVLIVLLKKGGRPDGTDTEEGGKPDGTDTGKGDVRLSSVAPVGLLLVVAPLGEIIAAVALGVVLAVVVIADIAVGVRNAKRAKAAENAQEPVLSYGDEAAAEGEAYPGTEVPADDGAEDAPDEDGMPE